MKGNPILTKNLNPINDDTCLVRDFIQTRDTKAFTRLVDSCILGIRRLLYSLLKGNREDMEDAEQEVLITLYSKLHGFQFRSSFRSFLYSICRNKAIDIIRKRAKQIKKIKRLSGEMSDSGPAESSPEEYCVRRNEEENVLELLFELEETDRTLIVLKLLEELSIKEIEEITGLPEGTIKSRLNRAKMKIKNLYQQKINRERRQEA